MGGTVASYGGMGVWDVLGGKRELVCIVGERGRGWRREWASEGWAGGRGDMNGRERA